MDSYEINKNTCAIISIDEEICKVIENINIILFTIITCNINMAGSP